MWQSILNIHYRCGSYCLCEPPTEGKLREEVGKRDAPHIKKYCAHNKISIANVMLAYRLLAGFIWLWPSDQESSSLTLIKQTPNPPNHPIYPSIKSSTTIRCWDWRRRGGGGCQRVFPHSPNAWFLLKEILAYVIIINSYNILCSISTMKMRGSHECPLLSLMRV